MYGISALICIFLIAMQYDGVKGSLIQGHKEHDNPASSPKSSRISRHGPKREWTHYHHTWALPTFPSFGSMGAIFKDEDVDKCILKGRMAAIEASQKEILIMMNKLFEVLRTPSDNQSRSEQAPSEQDQDHLMMGESQNKTDSNFQNATHNVSLRNAVNEKEDIAPMEYNKTQDVSENPVSLQENQTMTVKNETEIGMKLNENTTEAGKIQNNDTTVLNNDSIVENDIFNKTIDGEMHKIPVLRHLSMTFTSEIPSQNSSELITESNSDPQMHQVVQNVSDKLSFRTYLRK